MISPCVNEAIQAEKFIVDKEYTIKESPETKDLKVGRLHEHRILGIMLWLYTVDILRVTTKQIVNYYTDFFEKFSRSSISTYLNSLNAEGVLRKDKEGRNVYYFFAESPPQHISPIWIIRNFCLYPAYACRSFFLYQKFKDFEKRNLSKEAFFLDKAIKYLDMRRLECCNLCLFVEREEGEDALKEIKKELERETDLLPSELIQEIRSLGELSIFDGRKLKGHWKEIESGISQLVKKYKNHIAKQIEIIEFRAEKDQEISNSP